VQGRVRATDPLSDLAVVEVEATDLPAADLADELPEVGELALAMGNPLGLGPSVTAGVVSALHRAVPAGGQAPALVDLVQTDAAISPGNSGGALVSGDGEIIGINVAYIPPEQRAVSIGFAIPAPTVREVVDELLRNGEVTHAFLGVQPAPVTDQVAEGFGLEATEGAAVLSIVPRSPAAEAGIRPGDVIVEIGDAGIASVEDLFAALRRHEPGERIRIGLRRDGTSRDVQVTLSGRPD
jgi:serine protease DegQ